MPTRQSSTPGLFTENCVVLAEGDVAGGVLRCHVLAFPPAESRAGCAVLAARLRRLVGFGAGAGAVLVAMVGEEEVMGVRSSAALPRVRLAEPRTKWPPSPVPLTCAQGGMGGGEGGGRGGGIGYRV